MKKHSLSYFLILILLVLPVVSGLIELERPIGRTIDIKLPCFNNNTFCSQSSICNITLSYPDGRILFDEEVMQNQGSFHNITIQQANNTDFGLHEGWYNCADAGGDIRGNGKENLKINITGDGLGSNVLPTQLIVLGLGIIGIVVGKWKQEMNLFKIIGAMIVIVMGVITLYPGYAFLNHTNLAGQAVGFGSIGLGFYFLIDDAFNKSKEEGRTEGFETDFDDGRFHDND